MNEKLKKYRLSKTAGLVIRAGLPLMVLVFAYILLVLMTAPEGKTAWLYRSGYDMLEYAVMSVTLILCGGLVTDIAEKESV